MKKFLPFFVILISTMSAMAQVLNKNEKIRFLALGDSYTIGESVDVSERWPVQLVEQLRKLGYTCDEPKVIATTGWRTDDLKHAINAAKPDKNYNLVSLLIGVNNQYQGKSAKSYAPEFEELLQIAIGHAGGDKSKVFVVSIPDYGFTPFGREKQVEISNKLDEFNNVNKGIAEMYQVAYFNITDISRKGLDDAKLVAEDGLHPSGKMYKEWVAVILAGLKTL
jgi:lysophospholipase L1-like esterase